MKQTNKQNSTESDVNVLIGRYCPGKLLGQGPFVGLSTSAFTAGVRDAKKIDGKEKVFITADIFPEVR